MNHFNSDFFLLLCISFFREDDKMKSVIPFTKELDFNAKVNEITSISLEREFEVEDGSVDGNLFVSGDYKSHEISVNVIPFSFKIPFSIEIPDNIKKDSVTIEISDFAYDMIDESKIKVNIELELEGEEEAVYEEKEESQVNVDSEEIIKMLEEEKENERDEKNNMEKENERNDSVDSEENVESRIPVQNEQLKNDNENLILQSVNNDNEYTTYHIHVYKDGETIETICTMYNSNMNILADYNDLTNITPGDKLIIPSENE